MKERQPKPPFPSQPISPPGIEAKMDPAPRYEAPDYKAAGKLAGKRALITGGDSGIGRSVAVLFAREGADVAICHLPEEEVDAMTTLEAVREAGRKGISIPGDVRDPAFAEAAVSRTIEELGGLDILVNNAARQQWQPSILEISSEQFDATLRTNLYATFWITRAAVPHLPPGAAIINTTSVVVDDPPEILLDYSMTKAALANFTKCLAKQLAERGIRVNAVAPGPFWTPLQVSGGQKPENLESFGATTPLGRPGQPAELGAVYVLLASQASSYATGQVYGATGGSGNG